MFIWVKPPAERQRLRLACGSCICGVVCTGDQRFGFFCRHLRRGFRQGFVTFAKYRRAFSKAKLVLSDFFDQEERLVAVLTGQNHLCHIAAPRVTGNHQFFTDQYARYR